MKTEIAPLLKTAFGPEVEIRHSQTVGGGCINQATALSLTNGERVFVKYNDHPPENLFAREAESLRLLATADNGPRVPRVIGLPDQTNPRFLILEYIVEGSPGKFYYVDFARALAAMHRVTQSHYGLENDNHIGSTVQPNSLEIDGWTFFREHRLRFQQQLARKNKLLPVSVDRKLDSLCDQLKNLLDLDGEQPALLHGDLWSGNYFADAQGLPCIFDPAAHFGLREADLAMTELFGRLPNEFYEAYQEAFPLNPGYEKRKPIYNLYHLLNHLNLFGTSYLSSVESTLNRFA